MAARRLVIVMIVLLVISSIVAIIAPPAAELERREESATTVEEPEDAGWHREREGRKLQSTVDTNGAKPTKIDAQVGDVLQLEVAGDEAREIRLPELGLYGTQSPAAPARFDIYFSRTGTFRVIDAETQEVLARIKVSRGSQPRA